MPIYRNTEGGTFAPVSVLNSNDGGIFKPVTTAWVNDNGTFKKVFPNLEPIDASESGIYDTGSAVGAMHGIYWGSNAKYGLVVYGADHHTNYAAGAGARIPLTGTDQPIISSSIVRVKDASDNIIQTGSSYSLTGSAGTSTADVVLSNVADEQYNKLGYTTIDDITYLTVKNSGVSNGVFIRDNVVPKGTVIKFEWEWTIAGQPYYFIFPLFTLAD